MNNIIKNISKLRIKLSNKTYINLIAIYATILLIATVFVYAQYIPQIITSIPKYIILLLFLNKIVFFDWHQYDKKSKTIIICIFLVLIIQSVACHNTSLAQLFILSVGSKNLDFKEIVKKVLLFEFIFAITIIALSLINIIPNWTYSRGKGITVPRQSLGFQYSTYVSIIFLICTLYYIYIKEGRIKAPEYLGLIALNILAYAATYTRATLIFSLLAICGSALINLLRKKKITIKKNIVKAITATIAIFCIIISIALPLAYNNKNQSWVKINNALSGRLILSQQAINGYGIKPLGNKIEWVGLASIHEGNNNGKAFNIVDQFFVRTLVENGIIVFGIITVLIVLAIRKSIDTSPYLTLVLTVYLVWSITDPQMMQLQWNIFALFILNSILTQKHQSATSLHYKKININEIHKIQLSMLKKFAKFCDNNGLTYYLCGGTLLGAVRHKGFIPWDDDVDILMPRPDFEKLQDIIKTKKIAKEIMVKTPQEHGAIFPFIKIYNPTYKVVEKDMKENLENYIWLDVFPMDGLSANIEENQKLYKKIKNHRKLLYLKQLHPTNAMHNSKTISKIITKPFLILIANIIPYRAHIKAIDGLSRNYNYQSSDYVGGVMWGYGPQERMNKNDVDKRVQVEFEKEKFWTFSCYRQYLTNLYGDYMQLPPEENRQTHLVSIVCTNQENKDE